MKTRFNVHLILAAFRLFLSTGVMLIIIGSCVALPFAPAPHVDLKLKIRAAAGTVEGERCILNLHKASGQYLRMIDTRTGSIVHLKHLDPGIYTVCLRIIHRRERCQSIDLYTPQDGRNHAFNEELTAPGWQSPSSDMHSVSVQQLKVAEKARREMLRSIESELRDDEQGMIAHLKRALDIDPSYTDALNNLGAYYLRSGQGKLAIQWLKKVTQLNPDLYSGWVNLAGALLATNRREEALKAALSGLALRPEDAFTNSQVGRCYYFLNRFRPAEQYFKKVLALDPMFPDPPMLYLAWISIDRHREKDAEDYLSLFLKLHPYYPDAASWSKTLHLAIASIGNAPVVTAQKQ